MRLPRRRLGATLSAVSRPSGRLDVGIGDAATDFAVRSDHEVTVPISGDFRPATDAVDSVGCTSRWPRESWRPGWRGRENGESTTGEAYA